MRQNPVGEPAAIAARNYCTHGSPRHGIVQGAHFLRRADTWTLSGRYDCFCAGQRTNEWPSHPRHVTENDTTRERRRSRSCENLPYSRRSARMIFATGQSTKPCRQTSEIHFRRSMWDFVTVSGEWISSHYDENGRVVGISCGHGDRRDQIGVSIAGIAGQGPQ